MIKHCETDLAVHSNNSRLLKFSVFGFVSHRENLEFYLWLMETRH